MNELIDQNKAILFSVIVVSGIYVLLRSKSSFSKSSAFSCNKSLTGKTIIVTGGNSGIGYSAAKLLACHGASVILACRNEIKAKKAVASIRNISGNPDVQYEYLDLEKPETIFRFAEKIKKCNMLVNNAGLLVNKLMIVNDVELTMFTNHLGPFLLTNLLLPILKKTADSDNCESKIIIVASRLEKTAKIGSDNWLREGPKPFSSFTAYANSKLCNLLMSFELNRKLQSYRWTNISVNVMTPGMVRTNLGHYAPLWQRMIFYPFSFFLRSSDKGAETIIYMTTSEKMNGISGKYYSDNKEIQPSENAQSVELAKRVWLESMACVGLTKDGFE